MHQGHSFTVVIQGVFFYVGGGTNNIGNFPAFKAFIDTT